jgi:hypothetical protein
MLASYAIWAEIKRHRGLLLLGFLAGPLPVGLATIWPILTHETVPEWLVQRGWPHLTTFLFAWLAFVGVFVLVIVVQATRRHMRRVVETNQKSNNRDNDNADLLPVQLAEVESEWRKLDASQKQLLAKIYVSGELSWNQIDKEYKKTRRIYAEPSLFDYLLERSTLLDCANLTTLMSLGPDRSSFSVNPVWKVKPALRMALGEVIARRHHEGSSKQSRLTSKENSPDRSAHGNKYSLRTSLVTAALPIMQVKVHRLLAFWVQLIFITSVFAVVGGEIVAGMLVMSVVVAFPLCLVLSRIVNRSPFLSIVVGTLVLGILEGGFAYSVRDWAIRGGLIFGGFYGASLTTYFSSKSKYLDLGWVAIFSLALVGTLLIVNCSSNVADCVRMLGEDVDRAVRGAIYPIVLGLGLSPVITPASRLMESLMDRIVDLFPS